MPKADGSPRPRPPETTTSASSSRTPVASAASVETTRTRCSPVASIGVAGPPRLASGARASHAFSLSVAICTSPRQVTSALALPP